MTPALAIGFLLSGLVHEFIPDRWVDRHLGEKGVKGVLWSTLIGTLVPVCCWGCLPIAVCQTKRALPFYSGSSGGIMAPRGYTISKKQDYLPGINW